MGFGSKQIGEYKNSLIRFFDLFEVNTTQSSRVAPLESFYIVFVKLFQEKLAGVSQEEVLKLCKSIFIIAFPRM